jgi:hypothetical protein
MNESFPQPIVSINENAPNTAEQIVTAESNLKDNLSRFSENKDYINTPHKKLQDKITQVSAAIMVAGGATLAASASLYEKLVVDNSTGMSVINTDMAEMMQNIVNGGLAVSLAGPALFILASIANKVINKE